MIVSYAAAILLAVGIPTSWDSVVVGSDIHHSIADDYIGIEEFVQHAAWICPDLFFQDASRDDGRHMAAESECYRPSRICSRRSTITPEIATIGNSLATPLAAGRGTTSIAINYAANSSTPAV